MSITKVSSLFLLVLLALSSCDNPISVDPAVTLTAEEVANVMAAAGSQARLSASKSASGLSRSVDFNQDITVDGPDGGTISMSITMENDLMKIESTYANYVVKVGSESYTLNGNLVIQVTKMVTGYDIATGDSSLSMSMTLKGSMTITKKGVSFTQNADLLYSIETITTGGVTTGKVIISGTIDGKSVNETVNF